MNYIITEEELTSLEKTGNPSYRKSVEYVIGRIRSRLVESRQVMPDELLIDCPTCHGKKEWVDIESRTITLCPDCNDVSKALRDTINNEIEQVKKESERLKKIIDQTEQKIVYNILKKLVENEE
jgi:hypothetical protein